MANYKMSFSNFKEVTMFFKKKTCPNCGEKNLKRHFYKEFLGEARGYSNNNLNQENYYKSTAVYECLDCGRSFTLKGLVNGNHLNEESILLTEGESKASIKARDNHVTQKNRVVVGNVFKLVVAAMMIILTYGSIASGDYSSLMVFGPIVAMFALAVIMIFNLTKK